jgi:hypothetical protein
VTRGAKMFDPHTAENVFDQINSALASIHIDFATLATLRSSRVFAHNATGRTLITLRAIKHRCRLLLRYLPAR